MSENSIQTSAKTVIDVSGQLKGGTAQLLAKVKNKVSGDIFADSRAGKGGNIDITAEKTEIEKAEISATGPQMGGKVRIGGDYLGGNLTNLDNKIKKGFVSALVINPQLTIPNKRLSKRIQILMFQARRWEKTATAISWKKKFMSSQLQF